MNRQTSFLLGACVKAFVGTNPTGELITSGLSVIREEPAAAPPGLPRIR